MEVSGLFIFLGAIVFLVILVIIIAVIAAIAGGSSAKIIDQEPDAEDIA